MMGVEREFKRRLKSGELYPRNKRNEKNSCLLGRRDGQSLKKLYRESLSLI